MTIKTKKNHTGNKDCGPDSRQCFIRQNCKTKQTGKYCTIRQFVACVETNNTFLRWGHDEVSEYCLQETWIPWNTLKHGTFCHTGRRKAGRVN